MASAQRFKLETKQILATHATQLQCVVGRLMEKSAAEIGEEIENEIIGNPALEKGSDDMDNSLNNRDEEGNQYNESADEMQKNDYGSDDDDEPYNRYNGNNYSADDEFYEKTVANEETLIEHMEQQIGECDFNEHQRIIATHIIGNLSDKGYLERSPRSIADDITFNENIETETSDVDEVLAVIQTMEPAGIAARNVEECLLLQLQRHDDEQSKMARTIVERHFDDLANRRFDRIAQALGITAARVQDIVEDAIHPLNPNPGYMYAGSGDNHSQQLLPDFVVSVDEDSITLDMPNAIPELSIAQSYSMQYGVLTGKNKLSDKERVVKDDIKNNITSGVIFIKALRMRQETLYLTMSSIIKHQQDYFLSGGDDAMLKPMKLEDLAVATGRDKSTISRATINKYVDTPWGIKPLRFFFSEGMAKRGKEGEEDRVSTREIKHLLQELINGEDKTKPLSDDNLCDMLNEKGYSISRRTVAKYRDALKIPKAAHRKTFQ